MSRYLSEPEAWRVCAETVFAKRRLGYYLCHRIEAQVRARVLDRPTADAMKSRLRRHGISSGYTMWNVCGDGEWSEKIGRELRVTAALFLALEAEDELEASGSLSGGTP